MLKGSERVVIAYGSQTGNAQDLAERVWRRVKQTEATRGSVLVSSCDQLDLGNLINDDKSSSVLICVCATCGQGDVPDNMLSFWRSIMRRSLPNDLFSNLK